MKVLFVLLSIIVILIISFQLLIYMSINKTETQAYHVVRVEDKFEIRYYPSSKMAMITSNATSYRELGNTGFRKLAKYIFGGNNENKKIAMTSPVHMNIGDSFSTMAFVLPKSYNETNLPRPNDSSISISTTEPEYVAAIKFNGFASTEKINKEKKILEKALADKGLTYHGSFRFLGYNPPFQLFNRRNEVIVALNPKELNL